MYRLFGIVLAALKMSARNAVPMAAASRASRTNPSRRDSTVPAAITAAERRVRSAILRADSFFQRSGGSGGGRQGSRMKRVVVRSGRGLGRAVVGRRVAALPANPPVDPDERRTEEQGAGGADQDPADTAVLAGLDQHRLGVPDRVPAD